MAGSVGQPPAPQPATVYEAGPGCSEEFAVSPGKAVALRVDDVRRVLRIEPGGHGREAHGERFDVETVFGDLRGRFRCEARNREGILQHAGYRDG